MKKFVLSEMKKIKYMELPETRNIIKKTEAREKRISLIRERLSEPVNIIAEVKKSSPSAGVINETVSPAEQATLYMNSGASAISVLTEKNFFHGSMSDLKEVSLTVNIPVLCKDFIYYEEQINAAYLCGADVILLIAKTLDHSELKDLYTICLERGITPLIEVHHSSELEMVLPLNPELLLVNMRNLNTLEVDFNSGIETLREIPSGIKAISGSGINRADDIRIIKQKSGTDTFLIGTSLMKEEHPEEFIRGLKNVC